MVSSTTESATWTTAASTSRPRYPLTLWRSWSSIIPVSTDSQGGMNQGTRSWSPTPPSFSRWLGWLVHKAGEAVPVQSSTEALVAGRVGDPPRVPEAGAQTGSGAVRGGLDGWVAQRTTRSRSGLPGIKGFPFQIKEIEQLMLWFLTRLFLQRVRNGFLRVAFNCRFQIG